MERDLLRARLSQLPQLPPIDAAPTPDDLDSESLDSFPSTSSPLPTPSHHHRSTDPRSYTPISASSYFSQALSVSLPSSSLVSQVYYTPPTSEGRGTVIVCVHGAGYSGLSWARFAKCVEGKRDASVGVLAYDVRGHGKTKSEVGEDEQLSLEGMAGDLVDLLLQMYPVRAEAPSVLLVGHSMGGTVVTEACARIQSTVTDVLGLTIIDVLEGSALEALPHMSALISSRPASFPTIEGAIEWHVRSKTLNSLESARISVPGFFVPSVNGDSVVWRADLAASAPFWRGWFTGLSNKFLASRTAKLLIIAGADNVSNEKELLVGHMQGKFQLEVFPNVGHCVQEDAPEQTADVIVSFLKRNQRPVLAGVKKVGQV